MQSGGALGEFDSCSVGSELLVLQLTSMWPSLVPLESQAFSFKVCTSAESRLRFRRVLDSHPIEIQMTPCDVNRCYYLLVSAAAHSGGPARAFYAPVARAC
jgi:hypothetical protein